jgi:hypothetical protein
VPVRIPRRTAERRRTAKLRDATNLTSTMDGIG